MSTPHVAKPSQAPGAPRRAERAGERRAGAPLPPAPGALRAAVAIAALVLIAAPPASNWVWGVNALRSLSPTGALLLLLAAALAALAALAPRPGRGWAVILGVALALALAFPLRERIDFLSDTQLRLRSLGAFRDGLVRAPFADWAGRLHAAPLDVLLGLLAPVSIARLGVGVRDAVSIVCAALALAFFAALWRLLTNAGVAKDVRLPLALALALTGALEAFAGFPETAPLIATATAWWWAEAVAPLDRARAAARLALAWLLAMLAHRLAAVLLLPMLWRALGPAWEGDRPAPRRLLLALTLGLAALGGAAMALTGAGHQALVDLAEMGRTVRTLGSRAAAPSDWLNTLALAAPFALLAPFVLGRDGLRAAARHPVLGLGASAAVPLLLMLVLVFSVGPSSLGAQRDWDNSLILGLSLTVTAILLVARLPAAHLRARLAWALPALAVVALGFVAVQADEGAAERRAVAVATRPPRMPDAQTSHALLFLGQRAMDRGRAREGAGYFDRAFALNPNPRRALIAAEAWLAAGDPAAARRAVARARSVGPLAPELEQAARRIEALAADSARADAP